MYIISYSLYFVPLCVFIVVFLADRTAARYGRLLASSCPSVCLSVCLSVTLSIMVLRVGVQV